MDLITCPAAERARRLVRVKFMALPTESTAPVPRSPLMAFFSRVIGRLVAARP
jgi:hypothetical protein